MATVLPVGNLTTSAGLAYLNQIYYRREALDQLRENFHFRAACDKERLPKNSGRTIQFHRWNLLSASTTPATEGDISAGLTISNNTVQMTVSQFTSLITLSDLLVDTAPDGIVADAARELGYRAGRTVDLLTRNVIDSQAHNTNQGVLSGTTMTVSDGRAARHNMVANKVKPFGDGQFLWYIHPYVSYDVVNDPAALGLADIFKYTAPQGTELVKYNESGMLTSVGGCKLQEVHNCYSYTSSGSTYYRSYVFGKGGLKTVDLEGRGPSDIKDPSTQNFRLNVVANAPTDNANPEGTMRAFVSYNFVTTAGFVSGPAGIGGAWRNRTIDSTASLTT